MSDDEKSDPPRKGGCLSKLVTLFTLVAVAALGVCVWFIWQPQDLSDIKGRGPVPAGQRVPDLLSILTKAQSGSYAATVTEEDINFYLREKLQLHQGGFLSGVFKLEHVLVRISKDRAEIIQERSAFGRHFTVSMYMRVESVKDMSGRVNREVSRDGGEYFKDLPNLKRGGRIGKLEVPQGFIRVLLLPEFEKLATALKPEITAGIEDMARVDLSKGKALFDPREEGDAKPFGRF